MQSLATRFDMRMFGTKTMQVSVTIWKKKKGDPLLEDGKRPKSHGELN